MRSAALCTILLAGCATALDWVHPEHTNLDRWKRDRAQCEYEANAATASYSTGPTARTTSGAIAQGLGEGFARAARQGELMTLCLRARGYVQVPRN